jgi:hypothetical protein
LASPKLLEFEPPLDPESCRSDGITPNPLSVANRPILLKNSVLKSAAISFAIYAKFHTLDMRG